MKDVTSSNFGLLIAYLLPGFATLWGISYVSLPVRAWLGAGPENAPTVGGFLYVTLASVAAGMTVSATRWLLIDTLHHMTGIARPSWDFGKLQSNIAAFELIVEHQYRHYQFYGNGLISLLFLYASRHLALGYPTGIVDFFDLAIIALGVLFFLGSRDTYRKYIVRGNMFLGKPARPRPGKKQPASVAVSQDPAGGALPSPIGY